MTRSDLQAVLDARAADQARTAKLARYMAHRQSYLPRQIAAARLKLTHLEREAERLGVAV